MSGAFEVLTPSSLRIWEQKYRLDGVDKSIDDTWRRVANAAAAAEKKSLAKRWAAKFYDAISDFGFIPAGRILAGAGAGRNVTLFNCFVMGRIEDDMASIFESVKEAALTMQRGGGVGHDFSTLRPEGAAVKGVGAQASGPVSFMDVWDAMCRTIISAGARRGAMMATLRCDHPDIEAFVDAKRDPLRLRNFNVSVLVTDAFMAAVEAGAPWPLVFDGAVHRTVSARALWDKIMRNAYEVAEPGVIFIDRVNAENNLRYCETIYATNPCGEQPLPPYGACLLGSINLVRLVQRPFEPDAALNLARLDELVATAVRFLDCVIDVSRFPLEAQAAEARAKRRMGLGVTGLGDALILCGKHYGSAEARKLAASWLARIERQAYLASAELAAEKGSFPLFERDAYLAGGHARRLPDDIRKTIAAHGLRNGLLTSIAPTGTISLLAGNVSSGIEPAFDFVHRRRVLESNGAAREETIEDYAYRLFRQKRGPHAALPTAFVSAQQLPPQAHVEMQAALQPHVDSSISKTVNCPADMPFESFKTLYAEAYRRGLKGCTAYRPNPVTGAVLSPVSPEPDHAAPRGAAAVASPADARAVALRSGSPPAMDETDAQPLTRAPALSGMTYKLKWPQSDHATYVTINDIEHNGRRRPFEIFINSKNLEHYAWTVALTRMISAVFRRGGDVSFVVEELKAVFDPRGGYWLDGRYAPSLLAAIGGVVETHLINIGFMAAEEPQRGQAASSQSGPAVAKVCPRCAHPALRREGGCQVCLSCGFSQCD
ncbi:MAG: adenosylcobalamin-dependent ribonucleoside-diphosphate reductase [Hyphomicrobiales bacterium]|nr:adenosylcobalamin-dependent ribonucleoside-diphosphate reductase [Hyphomicrobiales bacterium]